MHLHLCLRANITWYMHLQLQIISYQVPGLKNFVMEVQEDQAVPCCFASQFWWICTGVIGCGYCYREGLKRISGKRDCHITKTIWMQQSQRQQFVQQQPRANSYAQPQGQPYPAQQQPLALNPYAPQQPQATPYAPQQPQANPYAPQQPQANPYAAPTPGSTLRGSASGGGGGGGGGGGVAEVRKLMELRDQGILSEDEFQLAKKKALGI